MFSEGDDVLVGFSGGADSVCLLSLLYEHRHTLGVRVRAAHVNHGIRGKNADADEAFVRRFCEERKIPLSVLHADVPSVAAETGDSTELCARKVRYGYFASLSPDKIATAHTLSDAEETFFMNLSRGASLHGLTSIPPVRGNIVRPLIRFTRKETERYCLDRGLPFVTDETNLSDAYMRNRYRHGVIPALETLNPSFHVSFERCLDTLRAEDDYMASETERLFAGLVKDRALDVEAYVRLHPALRFRLLARFLTDTLHADLETRHLKLIDENLRTEGFSLTLPGGERVVSENGCLTVRETKKTFTPDAPISLPSNAPAAVRFNGFKISFIRPLPEELASFAPEECIDLHKIMPTVTVRTRLPGDRITLVKRNCSKTLKKLYTELRFPERERAAAPVIADEKGVIWAYGGGVNADRAADKKTESILIIHSESDKNDK